MPYQSHPSVVPLLVGAGLLWANAGYLLWRRRGDQRAPGQLLAAGLVASFAVSVGAFALEQAHTGRGAKVFWNQVQYLGDAPLTAFLLGYVLVYVGHEPSRRTYAALFALPATTVVAVFTNGVHHLYWESVSVGEVGGYAVLDNGSGPLFYLYILYSYAFLVVALVLLVRAGVDGEDVHRRHALVLGVGTLLPAVAGVAYVIEVGPTPTPNYPGYAYLGTAAAFTYAVHRHELFAVVPVARRTAFEQMADGVITLDSRGRVAAVNEVAQTVLGRDEAELVGHAGSEVLGELVADVDLEDEGGQQATVETDDGVFDVTVRPLVRSEGVIGRLVVVHDVTERHRREQRLAGVNTRLTLALEGTTTGVWEWDLDTDDVVWDEQMEQLFGYEPGAFPGTYEGFADRVHPEDLPDVESAHQQGIEDGFYEQAFRVQVDGETRRWVEARAEVFYEDDEATRMVGIVTDVTERMQFERELQERNRQLEVLNRIVRHDIRNDMDVVLGYADELAESVDDEAARTALENIVESGEHVAELTDEVRNLMKTMLEDQEDPRPVSLSSVIDPEIANLTRRHDAVTVHPPADADVAVSAGEMLGPVFRNLLSNAVRHNDAADPEVDVRVEADDDEVRVRVADNGPGIPDGRKEAVFGRGEHGLESPGTGIGLYLVDEVVDRYGGDVWIEDNEPRGTVVVVELPTVSAEQVRGPFVD